MTGRPDIPTPPDGADRNDSLESQYDACLDDWKARARDPEEEAKRLRILANTREDTDLAVTVKRQDAARAAEVALLQSMQNAYVEVAKSSLDRAVTRASFMTGLITAISGTYTALLGLVYGVSDNAAPLPGRAMIPVVFLGAALVLASFYVAFLRRNVKQRNLLPSGLGGAMADERLKTFLDWVFSGVLDRAWALRTSIVAFGIGVALLPLPFADVRPDTTRTITIVGGALLVIWLGGELAYRRGTTMREPYVSDPPSLALDRGQ